MTYYVNATRLHLAELKQRHMEKLDMLLSEPAIMKKFDVDEKKNETLAGEPRKLADNELKVKRSNTELGMKNMKVMFPDFYPKFQYFSSLL